MFHDAKVPVTCDGEHCLEEIEVEPPYVYGGILHTSGYYDTSDDTLNGLIGNQDWLADGDKQYCPLCATED